MTRVVPLDDLPGLVGQDLGTSDWLLVDQPMIDGFAALCGDRQWIHVDVERARREVGGTIAHGFLSLSLIATLSHGIWRPADAASTLNYGFDKLRFTGAVPSGSRIRLQQALLAAEAKDGGKGGGILVTTRSKLQVEGVDRPALVADWLVLYRR